MDAAHEFAREGEGRVSQPISGFQATLADPATPYSVALRRKRGGSSPRADHSATAAPHTDPAQPEGRLGHQRPVTHENKAEAATQDTDPGDAGREGGHQCRDIQGGTAALANVPPQGGAGEGLTTSDVQPSPASPAKIRRAPVRRGAVDHSWSENQLTFVDSAPLHEIGGDAEGRVGHRHQDVHSRDADAATEIRSDAEGGVGQSPRDTQRRVVDPATITAIRIFWRKRQAWHRAEKALTLQAKALCRGLTEGDKGEADKLYAAALGKGEHAEAAVALGFIMPLIEARDGIERHRRAVEKHLAKLAKTLPVAPWVEGIRGVGIASLAGVIGEAGDLSVYANPGKLWKRMGVAPHQGRAYATWRSRGGLTAQDWTEAGYSPARRSVLWNVGACVVKAGGPLKDVYDARKAMELAKCEAIAADPEQRKLFAKDGRYAPKLHAHNRAQRYVEKRFLLLLWKEWRRAMKPVMPITAEPAAEQFREAAE